MESKIKRFRQKEMVTNVAFNVFTIVVGSKTKYFNKVLQAWTARENVRM